MKKRNARRNFAIAMLALFAIGAVALIAVGFMIFHFVFIEGKFWFDLSTLSMVARNGIIGTVGLVGTFLPIVVGVYVLIQIIGVEKLIKWLDKIMD